MSEKQQLKELVMFELRHISYKNIIGFIYASLLAIFLIGYFSLSGEFFDFIDGTFGVHAMVDVFVLSYAMYFIYSIRPKSFRMHEQKGGLYSAPFLLLLRTMPFSEKVIVRSRVYLYVMISLVLNSIVGSLTYFVATDLRELIPVSLFPVWLIVWNVIMLLGGTYIPASEAGKIYTKKYLTFFNLIFFIGGIAGLLLIAIYSGNGLFAWAVIFMINYPIWSLIISILIGFLSIICTSYYMKRYMREVDYHV
ncbi:hypothetical protein [Alkalicoccobacillus porphyridii]|uniref:ABC-2 transporter permease n=1 Tax=Alkalicoccobacillus porphyridii TaxID=2597270 RepID=A0A553ZUJ8_9BACI|nr:hypothetical protein [Alkalicoccobacillus porphyridii]TSB44986.1 hypothetical protein FN960_18605 [Alkalicoccobacillus porphyridii]